MERYQSTVESAALGAAFAATAIVRVLRLNLGQTLASQSQLEGAGSGGPRTGLQDELGPSG